MDFWINAYLPHWKQVPAIHAMQPSDASSCIKVKSSTFLLTWHIYLLDINMMFLMQSLTGRNWCQLVPTVPCLTHLKSLSHYGAWLLNRNPPQKGFLQALLFETNLKRYRAPAKPPGISKAVLNLKLMEPSFSLKQIKWRKKKRKKK